MGWSWDPPVGTSYLGKARDPIGQNYVYPTNTVGYIFHTDEVVTLPLTATPGQYIVRNWKGQQVASGTPSSATLNLGMLAPGSYRVYFRDPANSGNAYGGANGNINISVWRRKSGMPNRPTQERESNDIHPHEIMGAVNCPMFRFTIFDAADPNGHAPNLPGVVSDMAQYQQYYLNVADSARPMKQAVVHFSNGTQAAGSAAGVAQVVNQLGAASNLWYECRNEPDNGTQAQAFVPELQAFYGMVKAANPAAQVLGPNQVSINGGSQSWTERFFQDGGGNYIDGFSFHAYNVVDGELERGRANAENLIALLTKYGQQNKPRFMTEWGVFASAYGSFQPLRQLRRIMFELIFWEQYGIPKEHFSYFYSRSHGFWDYPSFVVTDRTGLMPAAVAMRVYAEELFGKAFISRINFGDEDRDFLGSLYRAPNGGESLLVLVAAGRADEQMSFSVSGTSNVTTVDCMGVEATLPVSGGKITVNVPAYPLYIRLPAGASATVLPRTLGRNLVSEGGWASTTSSSGMTEAQYVAEGTYVDWYPYKLDTPLPITLTQTLSQPTTFDTVVIRGYQPWQSRSMILDAVVEIFEGSSWTQVGTIHHSYTFLNSPSNWYDANCFNETYMDEKATWLFSIGRQVRTTQVRLIVTRATWGGEVSEVMNATPNNQRQDGQGWGFENVCLQAIELYNSRQAGQKQYVVSQ